MTQVPLQVQFDPASARFGASRSQKRLEDGQFDQCDLTFKELAQIEDAIISRMLAIYHSRISYPSTTTGSGTRAGEQAEAPAATTPPRAATVKPASA